MYENAQAYDPDISKMLLKRLHAERRVVFTTAVIVGCLALLASICGAAVFATSYHRPDLMVWHGIPLLYVALVNVLVLLYLRRFRQSWMESHRHWNERVKDLKEQQARQAILDDGLLLNTHRIPLT